MRFLVVIIALAAYTPCASAVEIATGSMLGLRYKSDQFYVRSTPRGKWKRTYDQKPYRKEARGKLMALRLAQGIFRDEWLTERPFDPEANTRSLIEELDLYKRHGVLGLSVSLQGEDPAYQEQTAGVTRLDGAVLGKSAGTLVSAFQPDGSLKNDWMERLETLLRAADERGLIVVVIYFYQGQDEVFEDQQAILNAARNATQWLIEKDFRNVIIDVADAWDVEMGDWDHGRFISRNVASLIQYVREQFNDAAYLLPIGASSGDGMSYPSSLAQVSDVVLLHGNEQSAGEKLARLREYQDYGRPVLIVDDDNGRSSRSADLARERASADAVFRSGAGWSYTPWGSAQRFPFTYQPAETSAFEDGEPLAQRETAYFRAILEHIARLTLRKPPTTQPGKKK